MLFKKHRHSIAERNYRENQTLENHVAIINGQGRFDKYRFGLSSINRVGCGIIAIHNSLCLLEEKSDFTNLIREFETNKTETIPFGFWGINPFSMKKFFDTHSISYKKIYSSSSLEKEIAEGGIYVITFWNDKKRISSGAHSVALNYINGKFRVFNSGNYKTDYSECSTVKEILGNGFYIHGYRLFPKTR